MGKKTQEETPWAKDYPSHRDHALPVPNIANSLSPHILFVLALSLSHSPPSATLLLLSFTYHTRSPPICTPLVLFADRPSFVFTVHSRSSCLHTPRSLSARTCSNSRDLARISLQRLLWTINRSDVLQHHKFEKAPFSTPISSSPAFILKRTTI